MEKDSPRAGAPHRMFRLLVSEYVTLCELGVQPIDLAHAVPSVVGDTEFLVAAGFTTQMAGVVAIAPWGWRLLGVQPYSWSEVAVRF